jgi:acyl-coenzyme A thioesterase PaaI-like protein
LNKLDLEKLKDLLDKDKITSNKKLLVYLFFVIISTIFWFLNALSKEYTTNLNYPVTYINFPEDKILTNELPEKLSLRVNAYGFDLLRYKLSTAFLSNPFNVNEYTNHRLSNNALSRYSLPTLQIKDRFEKELSSGIELVSIQPDTIRFEFSPVTERKVPVRLNIKTSFEQQFMQGGHVSLELDSILIKGAGSIVDTIEFIETKELVFKNLNKTEDKNVSFVEIEGVDFEPGRIKVTVPVEKFTEAEKNIALRIDNLPDSVLLRLFPNDIKVSYFVGLKKYENVSPESFDVRVDYNEASSGKTDKLKVEVKNAPDFISNLRYYPQTVSFLIEKREKVQ